MPFILHALLIAGATPAAAPLETYKDPKDDPDRVICRRIEETGSRLGAKKTCLKQSEWERRVRDAQDATAAEQQRRH